MALRLAVFLALAALAAGGSPARVAVVSGEVALRQAGAKGFKRDPEATGRRLDPGDQFKTLSRARAHVELPLGAVALMLPDSILGLEEAGTRPRASLLGGEALFGLLRPLDRGWALEVRTRSAVAISEGGVFAVAASADKSSRFRLLKGGLRVRAEGRTVRLRPGQEVAVAFGAAPSDPKPIAAPGVSTAAFAVQGSLSGIERLLEEPRAE